jgi:pimeloyl-ACP methyl ester carboxylesterase
MKLHFLHANGYPPGAYRPLLMLLDENFEVFTMCMRPLWPHARPQDLQNWLQLANDLEDFLQKNNLSQIVGVGHSMGATTTLRLALSRPDLFSALVLIDPVFFPPWMIIIWNVLSRLGLAYRLHPLASSALRRRNVFDNRQAMFDNYRRKNIFERFSDESLWALVDSLACEQPDGSITLCYSPAWEAHIYLTGVLSDMPLWRDLPRLVPPTLFLRGSDTNTFWESTAKMVKNRLPSAQTITIPDSTHLLPLEKPNETANHILKFLLADNFNQF